jgi:hypothetical protein
MRSAVEKRGPPKVIAKPKGNANKNYSLITEMGLDRGNPKENTLYNNILVSPNSRYRSIEFATENLNHRHSSIQNQSSHLFLPPQNSVRETAIKGGLDYTKTYKHQSLVKMGKIFAAVRDMLK